MLKLQMSCATDLGASRQVNQDSVAVFPQMNLVILADGMGGHNAGEVASRKAIESVRDSLRDGLSLDQAFIRANTEVYELSTQVEAYSGMGTTLVAALYDGLKVQIASVGDSRLYRFRQDQLQQLTRDETVAQDMRDLDIEHKDGKHVTAFEHVLTNALGIRPNCAVSIQYGVMQPGDIHFLCSDGIPSVLSDETISGALARYSQTLQDPLQVLFDGALRRSVSDNISAALVHARLKNGNGWSRKR